MDFEILEITIIIAVLVLGAVMLARGIAEMITGAFGMVFNSLWLRRKYEIMWLRLAVYVLSGRNFHRCEIISRRDNKGMDYATQNIERAIKRIENNYESTEDYKY